MTSAPGTRSRPIRRCSCAAKLRPRSPVRGPPLRLRDKLKGQFLGGVVLYTGARAYTHDGIQIVPISRLWRAGA